MNDNTRISIRNAKSKENLVWILRDIATRLEGQDSKFIDNLIGDSTDHDYVYNGTTVLSSSHGWVQDLTKSLYGTENQSNDKS